jgi:hypothetical protein
MKSTPKELRAYHTPQVMDYGNVKQITTAVSFVSPTSDGGTVFLMKMTA